ncbi:phosphoserine phosphatase SerB [Methanobrevibacter sp.]|uniref:phosphoserine phosphatase SerB n=1 Tax=Methanobrevibacter sp. TaxID=66852 RepID=UPI0026E04802|nr:phosphoserine phosphatase SerB [Methanobrevibacter sp.]MDO5859270.1 phosphoserine phosphatase SerB [Methanobrevibacter sp.]
MIKLVVFDLDNVIIDGEAIDEIGKLANVEDDIAEITEKAMQGEIDFETSIKDRVQLLEGTSIEEIEKVADELPLMPGACKTVKCLKDKDVDVAIISGSFDVVADKIKDKLGVDTVYTNSFTVEDGKLTGEVTGPLVSGSKLDVLKDHVEEAGITLDEVVAVGDGANDISMIESAGCGIAFNAKDSVKEIADVVVEEKDLCKVLDEILNQLTTDDAETETVEEEIAEEAEAEEAVGEEVVEDAAEPAEEDAEEAVGEEVVEDAAEPAEEDAEAKKAKSKKADKGLPESNFVLADTMEGVRKQKDEKEAEISKVAEEREEFNKIAKEQRKIRDELNASLKENLNKAIEFRNERNEINKAVEAAKKARNDANTKIKNLEWSSGKRDKIKIENEIKKIDKIIETRVLDIKKENQLVKNANDLRKQLMEIHEDESVKSEAQELKKLSEEEHTKVIELSEKAQAAHEEMLTYFRKTDDIRTAADEAHKKFIEARKNASAKHEEFKAILSDIHVINKKLGSNKPKRRKSDNKSSPGANKNREEKERAEEIFEKFKKGGKVSTEEILLLQKYNIG